jgi:hypothetical protein
MAPYKKPVANDPANKRFNSRLSSIRVRAENTIVQQKGRFQSLRGLFTIISSIKDHQFLVCWIRACAILHNLILEDGYNYENFEQDPDRINDPNEDDPDTPTTNDPRDRANREVVKMEVLCFHGDINT